MTSHLLELMKRTTQARSRTYGMPPGAYSAAHSPLVTHHLSLITPHFPHSHLAAHPFCIFFTVIVRIREVFLHTLAAFTPVEGAANVDPFMADVTFERLRGMLMENCMIQLSADDIQEETPLFGPDSIGLDSLDALQMIIAVEKDYGVAITDPTTAREALQSLSVLRDYIKRRLAAAGKPHESVASDN